LWVLIYREGPLDLAQLEQKTRIAAGPLAAALERLSREKRVEQEPASERYRSSSVVLMLDSEAGWEASMFDHYQSVVRTLCARLRGDGPSVTTGGSTYSFDVCAGHPLLDEVQGTLSRLRAELGELWERVEAHNRAHPLPPEYEQVTVYAGQSGVARGPTLMEDTTTPSGGIPE
jgi:hypothetical protein